MDNNTASQATVKYGGFWVRWVAHVVDSLILFFLNFIVGFFIGSTLPHSAPQSIGDILADRRLITVLILSMIVSFAYMILMVHYKQATLGRMLVGIKVTAEDGSRLSLGRIIFRETIGKIISTITLLIGYIMAAFTAKKQALHDLMVKSVVVYKDPANKNKAGLITGIVITSILGILLIVSTIAIFSSVVLGSLSTARNKGSDAKAQAVIAMNVAQALMQYDQKGSFKGYSTVSKDTLGQCTGELQVNVSSSGDKIAFFAKSCAIPHVYFCQAISGSDTRFSSIKTITTDKIDAGKVDCVGNEPQQQFGRGIQPADNDFEFVVPAGWQKSPASTDGLLATNEDRNFSFIGGSMPLPPELPITATVEQIFTTDTVSAPIKQKFPDANISKVSSASVAGSKAITFSFDAMLKPAGTNESVAVAQVQYFFMHGGKLYTLVFSSAKADLSKLKTDAEIIVKSIIFK